MPACSQPSFHPFPFRKRSPEFKLSSHLLPILTRPFQQHLLTPHPKVSPTAVYIILLKAVSTETSFSRCIANQNAVWTTVMPTLEMLLQEKAES